ncbi:MAG: DUF502 domain-containing protein [Gammaproteobacteria bacterium]
MSDHKAFSLHIKRNLIAGVLAIVPLWITWLVFDFVLQQLTRLGEPWSRGLSSLIQARYPTLAQWFHEPGFQSLLAVITTLSLLYVLGWLAHRVLGKKLFGLFDLIMQRIPIVQSIYGSVRKLLGALSQKPEGLQRVVLIPFPSPDLRTVGFVTHIFHDTTSGEELAAVYVPTTPNPTSGYLEIVPTQLITSTDWSMDEAMTFILSGGAVAPDRISLHGEFNSGEK